MKASFLLLSLAMVACGGATEPVPGAQPGSPATTAPPATPAPPVTTAPPAPGASTGSKGPGRPQAVTCESSVGECRSDAECGASAVCGCKVGDQRQNVCLTQSRCKQDSDCAGEKCNLSLPFIYGNNTAQDAGSGAYGGVKSGADVGGFDHDEGVGYFCTTPDDACVPGEPTNAIGDCVFGLANNHWVVGSKP